MPPPEFSEKGVYCTGDDCHKIRAKWERPIAEVTPPKSSIDASWVVEGFGRGKGSGGGNAPIHFGDTPAEAEQKENEDKLAPATPVGVVKENAKKLAAKPAKATTGAASRKVVAKVVAKSVKTAAKSSKVSAAKSGARKARR